MAREQIKLTFTAGWAPDTPGADAFIHAVKVAAARIAGGYTAHVAEGGWIAEAGKTRADRYDGDALETDVAFVLEITMETGKLDAGRAEMQRAIAINAGAFMPGAVDWVHLTETPVIGRHFSVAAMLAAAES